MDIVFCASREVNVTVHTLQYGARNVLAGRRRRTHLCDGERRTHLCDGERCCLSAVVAAADQPQVEEKRRVAGQVHAVGVNDHQLVRLGSAQVRLGAVQTCSEKTLIYLVQSR